MSHVPLPLNRVYLSQSISEPVFDGEGEALFYVRVADAKRSIVRQDLRTGLAQTITTEPMPKGGVGYGGGIFAVHRSTLVYAAKDGRLYGIDLSNGEQWAITPACEGVAAPSISPCGRFVAFLCEQDGRCNVLVSEVRGKALPVKLSDDPWYAFNPVFSPDGARIAWQEWDDRHMPWDEARIIAARFKRLTGLCLRAGELLPLDSSVIARNNASHASPQLSPDGAHLAYTSDETGWRSLWVGDSDGKNAKSIDTGQGEIGRPDWVPGLLAARWAQDGKSILAVRRHQGRDMLLSISWPEMSVSEIKTAWTEMEWLQAHGSGVAFVGSNPATPPTLCTLELNEGKAIARAAGSVGIVDPAALAQAEVISWETAGDLPVWGILYRAGASGQQNRPLIVFVHGGPTSEKALAWDAQAQYFATRGWHYLAVNYRGSTGYGREYQELLRGQWGVVDVQDACAGASHLVQLGLADPQRLVIAGASAGGYTTLMALTQNPDFWAAGISLFGIGNLYDLKQGSHRFEVNYEEFLIGKLPEKGPLWKERSPLRQAQKVQTPVLLFHGTEDKAVPHQQSVDFAEAVRRAGGIAELATYEGEGHGFQKEATRRDVIEKMERFLHKYVLCLQK